MVSIVPNYFAIIEDERLALTHENLLLVKKTPVEGIADVWLLLPNDHRFNKEYLKEYGQKISQKLKEKFKGLSFDILEMPQEFSHSYDKIGPSRYGVYENTPIASNTKCKNVFYSSPDYWKTYDPNIFLKHQKQILKKIKDDWNMAQVKAAEKMRRAERMKR